MPTGGGASGPRPSISGSSLRSAPQMPSISEDGAGPKPPLRTPHKFRRDKTASPQEQVAAAGGPTMPPPPAYTPALRLQPRPGDRSGEALAWNGAQLRKGAPEGEKGARAGWLGRRRWRWGLAAVLVVVVVGLVVGLAVGLTVGRRDKDDSSDSSSSDAPSQAYPAGSFSLNTTLQQMSTGCTSNAATWRCYPYSMDEPAVFLWIVTAVGDAAYNVSSTDNDFAIRFANRTTPLLDAGRPSERLSFSFAMDRTIIPDAAITTDNRAARCTFADTQLEATLWTRRHRNQTIAPPEGEVEEDFGDWPGDVEVVQSKDSTPGTPSCEDNDGNAIADVQAGSGECACRYASFEVD